MQQSSAFVASIALSAFLAGGAAAAFVTVNLYTPQAPPPAPVAQVAAIDAKELAREMATEQRRLAREDAAAERATANSNYRRFMSR